MRLKNSLIILLNTVSNPQIINEKIIDADMAGYHYHWYNNGYTDYSTYYFLTENGNVYATGSSYYYKNGKYPQANSYSPSRIIF